jgi:hypothetical protein
MPHRSPAFAFFLLLPGVAAMLALACTADLGGPVPPDLPASQGEVEAADQSWESAIAAAATTGQVTVLFDEAQLTTLLRDRVAAEDNAAFESPVVLLRGGTIQIYGVGHQGPLRANVYLSITPVLTPDGALGFELSSATFGPFPLPEGFRNSLSALMTEMLSGPLGSMATGVRITAVAIDSGQLAIVGELR